MKQLKAIIILLCLWPTLVSAAINAAAVWNVQTDGAIDNGGFFVTGATGTDYSKQAAPQWNITDANAAGAGLTITTTAAAATMVGNGLYAVGGTNVTVGWYEVASVVVGTSITVAGAGNIVTGAGAGDIHVHIGGALKLGDTIDNELWDVPVAGNTIYVKTGTYTITEVMSVGTTAGTATLPISVIGYKATQGDTCTGTDRPLFAMSTNNATWTTANYWILKNLRCTGDTTPATVTTGNYNIIQNCYFQSASAGATDSAIVVEDYSLALKCEAEDASGYAFKMPTFGQMKNCYAHDSTVGFQQAADGNFLIDCIADTCTTGVALLIRDTDRITNCTFYNCTTGITGSDATQVSIVNCLFDQCTTPINISTANYGWHLSEGNYFNCTNASTNWTVGGSDTVVSPIEDTVMTSPAAKDFTILAGSAALGTGASFDTTVGVVGVYPANPGADQDSNSGSISFSEGSKSGGKQ